jgi:flagellar basal-body rod protein FlgC
LVAEKLWKKGVSMDSAMAIAASGMAAASASFAVSSANIVNMQSDGPVPPTNPSLPVPQTAGSVYQPVSATFTASPGGAVQANTSNILPSYTLAYDPSAPFANLQGMVAAPNVDPVAEAVNQMSASAAFRANIAVFKVAEQNCKTLLDMLA